MTEPSEAALEAWIDECVAHLRVADSYDVLRPHANEFLLIYGIIARTVRYADGYRVRVRTGYGSEAVALARASLEHAVTLQWIFVVQGGIDRFRVDSAHKRKEHYSNLATWLNSDELAQELKKLDPPPVGKRMPPFMSILRDLD
ncbi:hypothetical protein [Agromyces laixinhei]|uniref:hypothetical protein n=1 Tax=Agromyces laixinhei TaxID=2585717 RepID=UPI001116CC3E|nr:hypothetical protein [Agromyces laixinhei]